MTHGRRFLWSFLVIEPSRMQYLLKNNHIELKRRNAIILFPRIRASVPAETLQHGLAFFFFIFFSFFTMFSRFPSWIEIVIFNSWARSWGIWMQGVHFFFLCDFLKSYRNKDFLFFIEIYDLLVPIYILYGMMHIASEIGLASGKALPLHTSCLVAFWCEITFNMHCIFNEEVVHKVISASAYEKQEEKSHTERRNIIQLHSNLN